MTQPEDPGDLVSEVIEERRVLVGSCLQAFQDAIHGVGPGEIEREELVIPEKFSAGRQNGDCEIDGKEKKKRPETGFCLKCFPDLFQLEQASTKRAL